MKALILALFLAFAIVLLSGCSQPGQPPVPGPDANGSPVIPAPPSGVIDCNYVISLIKSGNIDPFIVQQAFASGYLSVNDQNEMVCSWVGDFPLPLVLEQGFSCDAGVSVPEKPSWGEFVNAVKPAFERSDYALDSEMNGSVNGFGIVSQVTTKVKYPYYFANYVSNAGLGSSVTRLYSDAIAETSVSCTEASGFKQCNVINCDTVNSDDELASECSYGSMLDAGDVHSEFRGHVSASSVLLFSGTKNFLGYKSYCFLVIPEKSVSGNSDFINKALGSTCYSSCSEGSCTQTCVLPDGQAVTFSFGGSDDSDDGPLLTQCFCNNGALLYMNVLDGSMEWSPKSLTLNAGLNAEDLKAPADALNPSPNPLPGIPDLNNPTIPPGNGQTPEQLCAMLPESLRQQCLDSIAQGS